MRWSCRTCIEGERKCHKCPELDGDVMPHCMGSAALASGPGDLSHCTCPTPAERRRREREDVKAIAHRLSKLENFVYRLHADEFK